MGLGYDRYATLAVHELIEPDSVVCYAARDAEGDLKSLQVLRQNTQILEMCGCEPIYLPLGDLGESIKILTAKFSEVPLGDEIIAVPMGPKTHVLATLMVAQAVPRVTCLHPRVSGCASSSQSNGTTKLLARALQLTTSCKAKRIEDFPQY